MTDRIAPTAADVTPEWLNTTLGWNVTEVTSEPVGTGQMAENERFHLTHAAGSSGPASIVGKFASSNETSREAGASGGYLKEVNFYREVDDTVAIRTPECHLAEIDEATNVFTVLLEDMAPSVQGDQIAGCTVEEAEVALVNLAGLHGPRWNDESLVGVDWIGFPARDPEAQGFLAEILPVMTDGFCDRYASRLAPGDAEVLKTYAAQLDSWWRWSAGGFGLVHGDYRLDNLLFRPGLGDDPVAAVDWQTVSVGNPLNDVAYFLGNGLDIDVRRETERELVQAYHAALCGHGVSGYSFEQCFDDYRAGTFQGPLITVLGSMMVGQTDRGDDMFMAMASRSVAQIRDLNSVDILSA